MLLYSICLEIIFLYTVWLSLVNEALSIRWKTAPPKLCANSRLMFYHILHKEKISHVDTSPLSRH